MRGDNWRILAHSKDGERSVSVESQANHVQGERLRRRLGVEQTPPAVIPTPLPFSTVFDELVISPWLHLEQMDDGVWWMSVGGYHLWVHVNGAGEAKVTHNGAELSTYGMRADE